MAKYQKRRFFVAIKLWERLKSRVVASGYGKVLRASIFQDNWGAQHEYYLYGQQDFAVILPITKAGEVVTIRQYYQGCDKILRTLPGGNIDPSEPIQKTIHRELLEETGYHCYQIIQMGKQIWINTRNSWSHYFCFLGIGCEKKQEQKLDSTEDIEVAIFQLSKWLKLAETEIEDPCAIVATHRALPYLRELNLL
ncbi:MAG: hypothetical protein A2359_01070 [Candidatus Moranbacteria bacterium RIFOXYB1_FULL_43_19]|nr:MAG: hypothetical protein A2359_01070 [Candidatus Moranbacteria bacterium RIFOXYB1_FULL_43_19]OGI27420.1 MAG: hypothetical protein A2184_03375 [Candidatus Moranbacteria bacterium RIFOXYA1_FULL_44_7]OGI33006.1 MAG: hypothetical protein A2420_01495 [Candidatus Moranbacteria bacterium RIFOXYC1_FULL_44_13]OGI38221.1 MAG: hypothetical protein A2612_04480 [Candidatus Moranbacteria bacterium RIFOXYD1_FULL_44_12]